MRSYYTTGSSNGVTPVIKIGNSLPRFCGPGYPIVVLANKWTGGRKYHNSLISIEKIYPCPCFPICGMVIALTMQNPLSGQEGRAQSENELTGKRQKVEGKR